MKSIYSSLLCALTVLFLSFSLISQYQINAIGVEQVIDFEGFVASGFTPTPAVGQLSSEEWEVLGFSDGDLFFGATGTTNDYARGASGGEVTTGGVYSFDVGAGNGASLGVQPIGSDFTAGSFTLKIENSTAEIIENIELSYDVWVLNDQDRANTFNFEHGSDNISFTQEQTLDLVSEETAAVTPLWAKYSRSITLSSVSVAAGEVYYLKWMSDDVSGLGSRDEFALDNISITGSNPVLTVEPSELTDFEQELGTPSPTQTFEVSGLNLSGDIDLSVTGDYEISLTADAGFTNTLSIGQVDGNVEGTTIYVRLNGVNEADPSDGEVTVSSLNTEDEVVVLAGKIIEGCTIDVSVEEVDYVLTANATGVNYQWINCDDNFAYIPLANNQEFSPDVDGSYAVILTRDVQCKDTSDCILVAGVNTQDYELNSINVYPNPVNDQLNVELGDENVELIQVFNTMGNLVLEYNTIKTSEFNIETNDWESGVYFLNIRFQSGSKTIKVVK